MTDDQAPWVVPRGLYRGRHRLAGAEYLSAGRHRLLLSLSQLALPTRGMHEPQHLKPEEGSQP